MKTCNNCNSVNSDDSKFCLSCGSIILDEESNENLNSDINHCHNCGNSVEPSSSFCPNCGEAFGVICSECNSINTADAKYCLSCATPLSWICLICKHKNQAGALFCEHCGSKSIKQKSFYLKPKFIRFAATALILISVLGIKYYQLSSNIDKAYDNMFQDNFTLALTYAHKANDNWLPFTNERSQKAIIAIQERKKSYQANVTKSQTKNTPPTRSSNSSSNSSNSQSVNVNGSNIFSIKIKDVGFFETEPSSYTVRIQRTKDLNGNNVYDNTREDTHSSDFFGSDVVFYSASFGYYTVEYYGYDKYDRKSFHLKYSNVLHKCYTVAEFYTSDTYSPIIECY